MQFIPFYLEMILIKLQFLININSISIISWVLLSISITISITKTGPYQYQYIINFSNFSLSISIPISIKQIFLINISLSLHWAALLDWLIIWLHFLFDSPSGFKSCTFQKNRSHWKPERYPNGYRNRKIDRLPVNMSLYLFKSGVALADSSVVTSHLHENTFCWPTLFLLFA